MADKNVAKTATLIDTLVYFDEPQLLLLQSDRANKMLAVAIPALEGLGDFPFFACEVRDKPFQKYLSGKADLHHVFSNCIRDKYYLFDLSAVVEDRVNLTPATQEQQTNTDFWPEVGFFSRSHTSNYGLDPAVGDGEKAWFEAKLQRQKKAAERAAKKLAQTEAEQRALYEQLKTKFGD